MLFHLLVHLKGLVCAWFCPGSGTDLFSDDEKYFSFIHWGFHFWVHIWISKSYVYLLNVPFSNSMLLFHGYNAFLSFEDIIKTNFPVIVFLSLFSLCVCFGLNLPYEKCSQICGNHCSNLFIYWLHWGFIAAHGLSLVAESGV